MVTTILVLVVWAACPLPDENAFAGTGSVQVAATPDLYPSFDPGTSDYVIRCDGGPVAIHVDAPAGTTAAVDDQPARQGAFDARVEITTGQAFTIYVNGPASDDAIYHVRCLPQDFPSWSTERHGTPQSSFYVTTPVGYVAVFDNHGVPMWWMKTGPFPVDGKLLPDGNLAWTQFPQADPDGYEVRRLDGTRVRQVHAVTGGFTDPHDLLHLSNGDYLLSAAPFDQVDATPCGGPSNAAALDAVLQRVRPDGSLVWSWDTSQHISLTEVPAMWHDRCVDADPYHYNALEPVGDGAVLVSYRHLNAIYKVDVTTGEIVWKLGGNPTSKSLAIVGDPNNGFAAQHDIRSLGDGTVTLHDNGTRTSNVPRAVRYRIDETAKTATLVEEVTYPGVSASSCCGSARRLQTGNWIIGWGGTSSITEQTSSGDLVFRLGSVSSYRTQPVTEGLSAVALRRGMDARNPRASIVRLSGPRLDFQAAVGQVNNVTVSLSSGEYTITDTGSQITPQDGCVSVSANEVRCDAARVTSIDIDTADLDDTVSQDTPTPSTVNGGPGDDTLSGGTGADLLNGGPGTDLTTYASRRTPVTVSLDDIANDGAVDEGDNVQTENLMGGSAADTLTGSAQGNLLQGRAGDDMLSGNGGDDVIDGSGGDDTMTGGAGADVLEGNSGVDTVTYAARNKPVFVTIGSRRDDGAAREHDNVRAEIVIGGKADDQIFGDAAANILVGGPGDDTLDGRLGMDVLRGLGGNDTLLSRDGIADAAIDCDGDAAPGAADSAVIDTIDPEPTGCESVSRG